MKKRLIVTFDVMTRDFKNVILSSKSHFFYIFIIFILSFTPFLWTNGGQLILGHDTGWTLVPLDRFLDRFSLWTQTGFGYDQSIDSGTVTIYFLPALLSYFNIPIFLVQKITYSFWMFGMGISMYVFVVSIVKNKSSRFIALGASVFYVFNHYTLQAWTVAELSKFSAMILFPITLGLLWNVSDKKLSLSKALLCFGVVAFLFNAGGSSGIPLQAGLLASVVYLFFYKIIIEKVSVLLLLKTYVLFFIVFLGVNAYWIIPLGSVITNQYSPFAASGGPQGAVAWTHVISANTSIMNLLRLQGFSAWYDEPTHPYASLYLNNPIFLFLGMLIPLLTLCAFIISKKRSENSQIVFLTGLFLVSIFFAGGTHKPFGFIYEWLMMNVYGFAIFRTAFYKFGYLLWFTTSILFSYSFIMLFSKFKRGSYVGLVVLIFFILGYHHQYFTGSFFQINKDFRTRIDIPEYLSDTVSLFRDLPKDSRILLLPPPSPTNGQTDIYTFGYFSRTPLPYQLTQKSIVTKLEINTPFYDEIVGRLYDSILSEDFVQSQKLIKDLGITHFLLRGDVLTTHPTYRVISPKLFEEKLVRSGLETKKKQVGNWTLFELAGFKRRVDVYTPSVSLFRGDIDTIRSNAHFDTDRLLTFEEFKNIFPPEQVSYTIFSKCETCNKPGVLVLPSVDKVSILPTSPLYFLSAYRESKNLEISKSNNFLHFGYLYFYASKHAVELLRLSEQYIDIQTLRIDLKQRLDIISKYKSTLEQSHVAFKKLSEIERIKVSLEYKKSLESQREILRDMGKSYFYTELWSEYYRLYSLLNKIIEDKSLVDAVENSESINTYLVDIPSKEDYIINQIPVADEIKIDGELMAAGGVKTLDYGTHRIDVEKNEYVAYSQPETVLLDEKSSSYIFSLDEKKPLTRYKYSFEYHIQDGPAITLRIFDDLGTVQEQRILTQSGRSVFASASGEFVTNSSVAFPYKVELFAEKEGDADRFVEIKNIAVKEQVVPYLSLSSTGSTTKSVLPAISYEYVDSSHIKVNIENAKKPFILDFKESYSPSWHAMIKNRVLDSHFPANFTSNGWYVDMLGTYTIDLVFMPANYYLYGWLISMTTGLLLFINFLIRIKR